MRGEETRQPPPARRARAARRRGGAVAYKTYVCIDTTDCTPAARAPGLCNLALAMRSSLSRLA